MSTEDRPLLGEHILLSAEYLSFGGTRTYLLRLIDFFHRAGAHVTLVTTLLDEDRYMANFMDQYGFDVRTFPAVMADAGFPYATGHPTVWSHRQWRRERQAFQALGQRIGATRSIVSVGTPGLLLSAAAALPRSLVVVHGYPHGLRQKLMGRQFLSRLIPEGTTFVSLSEYGARIIRDTWNLDRSNSRTVTVLSTDGEPRLNHSAPTPPWTVLTASLVEPYKRPHDWVEVADQVIRRLPEGSVDFIWLGDGSLLEQAREDAASRPSAAHIHFPGVSWEVESHYERARVYLQLSSIENMSLSTLDAQRHGVPCVVTDVGGFPEIVIDGINGRVVPCGATAEAAEAVGELLGDSELWESYSTASAQRYLANHSPASWEEAFLSAYTGR